MRRGILRSVGGVQKPGFFLNPGDDAKIITETRFLGFTNYPQSERHRE